VKAILDDQHLAGRRIVHFCNTCPKKTANAAYLMCSFLVMICRKTAQLSFQPFERSGVYLKPFRDACQGPCPYQCTVLDCVAGLEYAMRIRWFHWESFDVTAYEYYEKLEHGDMNWVVSCYTQSIQLRAPKIGRD
jgi:cell division cycle 14